MEMPHSHIPFARPVKALAAARKEIADCIGAQPEEIFSLPVELKVTTGQSKEHYNMAIIAQL